MFEIEKNIPVPTTRTVQNRHYSPYPFNDMGVGDSFFVPVDHSPSASEMRRQLNLVIGSVHSAAATFRKRHNRDDFVITCRSTINPHGDTGVRVWRTRELTKSAS